MAPREILELVYSNPKATIGWLKTSFQLFFRVFRACLLPLAARIRKFRLRNAPRECNIRNLITETSNIDEDLQSRSDVKNLRESASRYSAYLAGELQKLFHEIDLFFPKKGGPFVQEAIERIKASMTALRRETWNCVSLGIKRQKSKISSFLKQRVVGVLEWLHEKAQVCPC